MYYDTPDYNYWYAPGAIYQYDPGTSMITSVAALLSPGFAVGQAAAGWATTPTTCLMPTGRPTMTRRTPGTGTTMATSTRSTRPRAGYGDRRVAPDLRTALKFAADGSRAARHALPGHFAARMNKENTGMKTHALALGVAAAALLALGACSKKSAGGNGTEQPKAQTPKAAKAAGTKTIAAGLAADSRFMAVGEGRRSRPDACRTGSLHRLRSRRRRLRAGPGGYARRKPEEPGSAYGHR